jgi:hypothetical protein
MDHSNSYDGIPTGDKLNNLRSTRPKKVFLSYYFKDKELAYDVKDMLEAVGFTVLTGEVLSGHIGQSICQRIRECDYFFSFMTRHEKKADGSYTTSPWLLEEKGAAIGKPMVIMVERNVTGVGQLEGDLQRISFTRKRLLRAVAKAVKQLQSYSEERPSVPQNAA